MTDVERLQREAAHFDAVYRDSERDGSLRISDDNIQRYRECRKASIYGKERLFSLAQPLAGREVLEIGCGTGVDAIYLVASGAEVWAYDVSEEAIRVAARRAEVHGYKDRIHLAVASRPDEAFDKRSFDVVFGNLVLHHLDLAKFGLRLPGLLKPGGRCVFREAVIRMPILRTLRRIIPWYTSNPSPDERPLSDDDIAWLTKPFAPVEIYYYEVVSRFWYLQKSEWVTARLHEVDARLLRVWKGAEDRRVVEIYQGDIRKKQDPEAIGIYKISHRRLLRDWKAKCMQHTNLLAGQNLPFDVHPVYAADKGKHRFEEINTVMDYLRALENRQRGR